MEGEAVIVLAFFLGFVVGVAACIFLLGYQPTRESEEYDQW